MSALHTRRAGASLFAHLTTPSRTTLDQPCQRTARLYQQHRAVSTSNNRWQQSTPAATSAQAQAQQPTPAPPRPAPASASAQRTPIPQTAASQVAQPQPSSNSNSNNNNTLSASGSGALRSLTDGLTDPPPTLSPSERQVDWTRSYHGLSSEAFTAEQAAILQAELHPDDIEIKPDGILYLPEIKYRRILNKAFGPGGWGLAPRGETIVTGKLVTREYGLVCGGRLVSLARGEQQYFDPDGIPTATEGCKSNALMRCCKDLGIASELWDPRFIRGFMKSHVRECMVEHATTKRRRKHYMRKDDEVRYPFKIVSGAPGR